MKKLQVLISYEFQRYLTSSFFYNICSFFLFLMGVVYFFSLKLYADFAQDEPLMMQLYKSLWLPSLFIVPILTMKAIVAEKTQRIWNAVRVLPVSNLSIVISKFVVIYVTYILLWLVVCYFPELSKKACPVLNQFQNFSTPHVRLGGLFFISLFGGVIIAFGLFISAHTKTTATSMAASSVGIFLFLVSGQIFKQLSVISLSSVEVFDSIYDNWNIFFQLEDFCRGILDTRIIIGYISVTIGILFITSITMKKV